MIQKITSNEYLKRVDNMTAAEKDGYVKRVGEWLEKQAPMLLGKTHMDVARFQNAIQCSAMWNDDECKAWTEGARLLSAMAPMEDTWLPDMLYVKAARRSIHQMATKLKAMADASAVRTDLQSGREEYKDLKSGKRIGNADTQGDAITNHSEQDGSFRKETGDGGVGVGDQDGQGQEGLKPVPVRPKHIDQYVHLLPQKTQENAKMYGPLMRELDVARQKMELLMNDPNASAASREQWAKTATKLDGQIKSIRKELDSEWAKLVKQGRVVVDDLGNVRVVTAADAADETDGDKLTSDQKQRRRELRKWLVDTRRGNGDTREEHIGKWRENFAEYLTLEGDAAFGDAKIIEAAKHYGLDDVVTKKTE